MILFDHANINRRLCSLESRVAKLEKENKVMADTINDLNAELAKADTAVASLQTEDATVLADLAAAQSAANPDLTAQVQHIQQLESEVEAVTANETAATTPAPAPAPVVPTTINPPGTAPTVVPPTVTVPVTTPTQAVPVVSPAPATTNGGLAVS